MPSHQRSAEAIIVGGGVIGAAILFELARRGVRAVMLERAAFGAGGTGQSAAIVRMHYSNRPVVRMALRSRLVLAEFHEITGSAPVYEGTGWAFLVPEGLAEAARTNAQMNREEGVDVREIGVADLDPLFPGIRSEGIQFALFEPGSGFADPVATVEGYIAAARRLGASAREEQGVIRLVVHGDRVVGVETAAGVLTSELVVLAAGPWSGKLASGIGLELPMEVTREQELVVRVPAASMPRAAMSNAVDCIYARPLTNGQTPSVLVGRGFPKDYELVDPDARWDASSSAFEEDLRERLERRLPDVAAGQVVGSRVGLYDVTPDWHPYLGRVDGLDGLVLATGGSGHCFKLAPAIGELVVSDIVGETVDFADIELFNLRRLREGAIFDAAIGGNRA